MLRSGSINGRPGGRLTWLRAALLVAAIVAVYSPALWGDFVWDDDRYVAENRLLREPDGLWRIWFTTDFRWQFFPLTLTVFRGAYQIWGLDTFGYHLLNVGVHALNSLLLWALLLRLGVAGAGVAAAIFALHPIQVESVAWITELKNLLSTTFYLLAIYAYLRFEDSSWPRWYLAALALFVLALFSKAVACTLPGAILVLRWWRGKPVGVREIALLLPFFVFGMGMALLVSWYEVASVGTAGREFALSLAERFLIAGRALWFYLGKLAVPAGVAFSYPRWQLDPADSAQWAWHLALVCVALFLWFGRQRLGRGPAAGLAFFAVAVSPMLGFVGYFTMRYSFVADHYQYLACVGPITVVTAAGAMLFGHGKGSAGQARRLAGRALAGVVLGVLAALSWQQAHAYRSPETLWRDTIAKNPTSWMAHNNLANVLVARGHLDEAVRHYRQALQIKPDHPEAHTNLGAVMYKQGNFDEALRHNRQALQISPNHAKAHANLGAALYAQGEVERAIGHYMQALRLAPSSAETHSNLGLALRSQGKLDEALRHYRQALEINPDYPEAHNNLGVAMYVQGRLGEAIRHYRRALEIQPNYAEAHNNLGAAMYTWGSLDEAIRHYRRALEINPEYAEARHNLNAAIRSRRTVDDAIQQ